MADVYVPLPFRGTPLEQVYIDAWVETGDAALAREAVRASPEYDNYFAGNRRDDGSVRYDEATYLSIIESFGDSLLSIGLNPDLFSTKFADLVAGNVSPAEFANRIENVYTRVIDAAPEVMAQMSQYYEIPFNTASIVASFLDPDIASSILEKRIAVSEVGAEASKRGFTVARDFANMLYEAGTDTASEAAQFFGLAENAIPTLQALVARHNNPDDTFDLGEFASAQIFNDPEQRRRIRLVLAQERADFSSSVGSAVARASQGTLAGGLTGLAQA